MDKIDIEEFYKGTVYFWNCSICETLGIEYENLKEGESVHCNECGNTFEITKTK